MKRRNFKILKRIKRSQRDNALLNKLLLQAYEEDEDLNLVVQGYWDQQIFNNESERYSNSLEEIRNAFQFLRKIY